MRSRRRQIRVLVILGVVVACIASHPLWVGPIAAWWIMGELEQRGFEPQALEISQLGLDGMTATRLVLGEAGDAELRGVRVDWSLSALWERRVDGLRVEAARAQVWLAHGEVGVGNLAGLVWDAPIPPAFAAEGELTLTGSLASLGSQGGWNGSAEARLSSRDESLRVEAGGRIEASRFDATASVAAAESWVVAPLTSLDLVIEAAGTIGSEHGTASLRAHADLVGPGLGTPSAGALPTDLTVELAGNAERVEFSDLAWTLGPTSLAYLGVPAELRGTRLLASGVVGFDEEGSWLRVDECAHIEPGLVRIAEMSVAWSGPVCVRQTDDSEPLASWTSRAWRGSAELRSVAGTVHPENDPDTAWDLELPLARIALSNDVSPCRLLVAAERARLGVSEPPFLADGLSVRLVSEDCGTGLFEGRLETSRLRSTASPAWFAPLAASADLEVDPSEVRFSGQARGVEAPLELRFEGKHALQGGEGEVRLALAPIELDAGSNLQARFPISEGALAALGELSGALEMGARLSWNKDGLGAVPVEIGIRNLSARGGFGELLGLDGQVRLANVAPATTDAPQTLSFRRIDLGDPIEDGRLRFSLRESGRVAIEELRGTFAGGGLAVRGQLDPGLESGEGVIDLSGARVERLLAIAPIDGLEMSGALHVRLPIRLGERDLRVVDATFRAGPGGGILRYRPEEPPESLGSGETRRLILEVLEDFRYDTFEGRVSGDLERGIELRANVRGESTSTPPIPANVWLDLRTRIEGAHKLKTLLRAFDGARARSRERTPR